MDKKQAALTQEQVDEIRKTYLEDNSKGVVPALAELYNVSTYTIYSVLNYKSPYTKGKPSKPIIKRPITMPKRGGKTASRASDGRGGGKKPELVTRSELEAKTKAMSARWNRKTPDAVEQKPTNKDFICPHCLGSGVLVPKNMSLGQLLLFHRHRLNMTSNEVAKKTKVSHGIISLYERDKVVEPKFTTLWPLLQFYEINPNDLPPIKKVYRGNRYSKG